MPYDPCSCVGNYTPSSSSTSTSDCLLLGTIVIANCDSAAPCGATGTVSFECFDYECETPPSFVVTYNSRPDILTVTDISSTGLDYQTSMTAVGDERVEITFYATCGSACGGSSAYGTVIIYIKNLCRGIVCQQGYSCAACTGLCVPTAPEVQVNNSPEIIIT